MDLYKVSLIAEGIQVTASDSDQADRYAREDARDFSGSWNHQRIDVELAPSDADITESPDDADVEVTLIEGDDRAGEQIWTYEASFTVTVAADCSTSAAAAAKTMLQD